MKPRKRKWIRCGDTHILMELNADNLVPEWHIIGYVLKRRVYESLPAGWYAFQATNRMILDGGVPDVPCRSLTDAKELVQITTA